MFIFTQSYFLLTPPSIYIAWASRWWLVPSWNLWHNPNTLFTQLFDTSVWTVSSSVSMVTAMQSSPTWKITLAVLQASRNRNVRLRQPWMETVLFLWHWLASTSSYCPQLPFTCSRNLEYACLCLRIHAPCTVSWSHGNKLLNHGKQLDEWEAEERGNGYQIRSAQNNSVFFQNLDFPA